MRKNDNLTQKVMEEVVGFEKRRSIGWLIRLLSAFCILFAGFIFFIVISFDLLKESQSLDMFALFGEDREVITQYWREVVDTFWTEMPLREILIAVLLLVILLILFITNRKKINTTAKRVRGLAIYIRNVRK